MIDSMIGPLIGRGQRWFWDLHSRTWDDLATVPAVAAHRADLVDWFTGSLPPGHNTVVDLGCGTGELTIRLASVGVSTVGLDFSPAMLTRARVKANTTGTPARFCVADLSRPLPLGNACCQGALCVYVLQVVAHPTVLLGEIHRVLGPNGVALFDIPRRGSVRRPPPGTLAHRPFWLAKRALVRTGQVLLRYQPERLIATIEDAGFRVLQQSEFAESIGVLASARR